MGSISNSTGLTGFISKIYKAVMNLEAFVISGYAEASVSILAPNELFEKDNQFSNTV